MRVFLLAALSVSAQTYRAELVKPSAVVEFQVSGTNYLAVKKANGDRFQVWYTGKRYILQEGSNTPVEYVHGITGEPVLPSVVSWNALWPHGSAFLGHTYKQVAEGRPAPVPQKTKVVKLRPDLWIGPAHNTRQKDETRRYDESDYEYVRFIERDYRLLRDAGATVVNAQGEQVAWANTLGLFYWGDAKTLPYPEMLYRPQFLGPTIFVDEPAVGTRDHDLRPLLAKDAAYRQAITPQLAFSVFQTHFARVIAEGPPWTLHRIFAARPDIDLGTSRLPQANLYTWETMISTGARQLESEHVSAIVFEPPGRMGSRRTIPEWNMAFGVSIPPNDPRHLIDPLIAFLRGAARARGKQWGVSIYGAVDKADAPYWLTRAYDLGATRFHFWDTYQLACVPFGEVLELTGTLRRHADANPKRDLKALREAAATAFVVPVGFDLGHVHSGKGLQWGLPELHLERTSHREIFHDLFTLIEKALAKGETFDIVPEGVDTRGYKRVVHVDRPRLKVTISRQGRTVTARAETPDDVYYTRGANRQGVYENDRVFWELYGPDESSYRTLLPTAPMTVQFDAPAPGRYRLRAAICDQDGRTRVRWLDLQLP